MTNKKSKSADLETKRFAFFQVGLIVALAVTLLAFEYSAAKPEEQMVQLDTPEEPIVTFSQNDVPVDLQRRDPGSVLAPPNPGIHMIEDSVQIVEGFVDPRQGIYVPPGPIDPDPEPIIIVDPPIGDPIDPVIEDWTVEPKFPGGTAAMIDFISKNVTYPMEAVETNTQGTVYVEFVINRDGSICEVNAKNQIDRALEKEAMRVVSIMPNWTPGEQMGKKVRVRYVIPIKFSLH